MIEKEYIEPNEGFSQTVVVKTGNFKTLYISGQIGDGADLKAQTITTFQNLEKQLIDCDATFKDVVKMNTYIVNFHPEVDLPIFRKVRKEFLGNVSHELKTPLFTVQGYLLTLADGAMDDKKISKKNR